MAPTAITSNDVMAASDRPKLMAPVPSALTSSMNQREFVINEAKAQLTNIATRPRNKGLIDSRLRRTPRAPPSTTLIRIPSIRVTVPSDCSANRIPQVRLTPAITRGPAARRLPARWPTGTTEPPASGVTAETVGFMALLAGRQIIDYSTG